jgi:hypothetical protein
LLLQHLPGGLAHLTGGYFFSDSTATEIGLRFTAVGTVAFVVGVVLAQHAFKKVVRNEAPVVLSRFQWLKSRSTLRFALFCVLAGWLVVAAASLLARIPSLGAAIDQAGSIWILGVLVGMLVTVKYRRWGHVCGWVAALAVYPVMVLVNGGFLSFGSTSVFAVLAALLVSVRSHLRAYTGLTLFSLLCFLAFLSYFQNRNNIREAVWGGAILGERIHQTSSIITDIRWFDPDNPKHLDALDQRLNQNYFAGAAAQRIQEGQVQFKKGTSILEGLQALVPRAIWPEKPTFAGSSDMIREMSGFMVNENTSFGVGQVMEFYINFGIPSLIIGYILFGFAYGWMDQKAAMALYNKDYGSLFIWFLTCIGMLAPLASIAEVMGNVAAAFVAAYGWRWAWQQWSVRRPGRPVREGRAATGRRRRKARPGTDGGSNEAEGLLPAPASTRIEDHGG